METPPPPSTKHGVSRWAPLPLGSVTRRQCQLPFITIGLTQLPFLKLQSKMKYLWYSEQEQRQQSRRATKGISLETQSSYLFNMQLACVCGKPNLRHHWKIICRLYGYCTKMHSEKKTFQQDLLSVQLKSVVWVTMGEYHIPPPSLVCVMFLLGPDIWVCSKGKTFSGVWKELAKAWIQCMSREVLAWARGAIAGWLPQGYDHMGKTNRCGHINEIFFFFF